MKPDISVIMPAYNAGKYIKEAIDSVTKQTYKNWELIVVDDGSEDDTVKVIKAFKDTRIRIIQNEKNLGIVRSLKKAISAAEGKYLARLDSDDIAFPERLAIEYMFMENNSDVSVCGGWAEIIDEEGIKTGLMKTLSGVWLKYNYWKPSPIISSTSFIRSRWAKEINLDSKYVVAEDYDLWMKLSKMGRLENIKKALGSYRVHKNGISKKRENIMWRLSYESFLENIKVEGVSYENFLVMSSLRKSFNIFERVSNLVKLSRKINYPYWFIFLDTLVYIYRNIFGYEKG